MIGSSDYYASAQLQSVVYQVLMLDQKIRQNNDKNNYKSNEIYLLNLQQSNSGQYYTYNFLS